ncbi:MAG: Crp/Fnr family transcriptional regulator [Hyphomicrobiaceae bacterium]
MSPEVLVLPMLSAQLFTGLQPMQLKVLALHADRVAFQAGERLVGEGEEGDAAFLVVSGTVAAIDSETGETGEPMAAGTVVGEMAMFIDMVHGSSVVALEGVAALKFERSMMTRLMTEDPELAGHFVECMRERLLDTARRLREIDEALPDHAPMPIDDDVLADAGAGGTSSAFDGEPRWSTH